MAGVAGVLLAGLGSFGCGALADVPDATVRPDCSVTGDCPVPLPYDAGRPDGDPDQTGGGGGPGKNGSTGLQDGGAGTQDGSVHVDAGSQPGPNAPLPDCTIATDGPTDVSGGIFADTVWCAKNSPIRLSGKVVVFEGAKLTVRDGVRIEAADGAELEIRNGSLRTAGTADAPVLFTSGSAAPQRGSWLGLDFDQTGPVGGRIEIEHTIFEYAAAAIWERCCGGGGAGPGMHPALFRTIKSSVFRHNGVGIGGYSGNTLTVEDSVFEDNGLGARDADKAFVRTTFRNNGTAVAGERMRITDSVVTENETGLSMGNGCIVTGTLITKNDTGLINFLGEPAQELHELTIAGNRLGVVATNSMPVTNSNLCGNTDFDFRSQRAASSPMTKNHWCTTDEATIAAHIFDGHDDVQVGLVSFSPLLAAPAVGAPAIPAP